MNIDTVAFFDSLAKLMHEDPNRYELLGDIEMTLAVVMERGEGDQFMVSLGFDGIDCDAIAEISAGEEKLADCWLEGDLADWQAMFANIAETGGATGDWTLNTATMVGDKISLRATDPMGWDKFHRFNQTLQDFVDAASQLTNVEVSNVGA